MKFYTSFFSQNPKKEQLVIKKRKFKRELEKNEGVLKKTKDGKDISEYNTREA